MSRNQNSEKLTEFEQLNKMMKKTINTQDASLKEEINRRKQLDEEWQRECSHLQNQLKSALEELEQYRVFYENHQYEQQMEKENEYLIHGIKKETIVKEIQNILGELGTKKQNTVPNGSRLLVNQVSQHQQSRMTLWTRTTQVSQSKMPSTGQTSSQCIDQFVLVSIDSC
jgi:hypothetical protein